MNIKPKESQFSLSQEELIAIHAVHAQAAVLQELAKQAAESHSDRIKSLIQTKVPSVGEILTAHVDFLAGTVSVTYTPLRKRKNKTQEE